MFKIVAAAVVWLASTAAAFAYDVRPCVEMDPTDASAIAEPWEKNAHAYYNGQVRVAVIDTGGEPVCCSQHLLILVTKQGDEGELKLCFMANSNQGLGFAGIDFARLTTRYDAGKGLLITFPYDIYNDGKPGPSGIGRIRVNVAKGTAVAE